MLKKELGFLGVFSIAAGAMISSGLFVLPGIAYKNAGPAVVLAYALSGILMIPVILAKTELATAMPKAGGSYFFIERSLGPLAGTLAGFANWLSIALKSAFALVGIGVVMAGLLKNVLPDWGEWNIKLIACAACLIFAVLNLVSTKGTGQLQVVLVAALLVILVVFVAKGLFMVKIPNFEMFVDGKEQSFMPLGLQSVFAVSGMVFVSYGGLTKVASIGEEVKNPSRNLPLGMFAAFIGVCTLYILVVFVTVGIVKPDTLANSYTPIADGAFVIMGTVGTTIIGVAAFLAFATTANSGIMAASRSPMAMSRDGLLPEAFARTSKRFSTPYISIAMTALFIMAILFLSIENLVKTASTMMILMFMMVNLSVIIMRKSGLQNYRPTFRAPLCPWLQVISIIVMGFLIFEMGVIPLLLTGAFALVAIVWYLAYVHRKIDRESAFVHMVKQALSPELAQRGLEEELKQITIERDEISLDRFDHLVKDAAVLDFEKSMPATEFFEKISEELSNHIDAKKGYLEKRFLDREMDSSTVLRPGLAIPHVIVEGEKVFYLLIARCKEGVVFSELSPKVHIAFVLVGSQDERNFHLRALMNIAHIVETPDFDDKWLKARNIEQLRDIVLMAKRRRDEGE